jgi:hypothetical protein
MARNEGLETYFPGMSAEWIERLLDSDDDTDVLKDTARVFHKPTLTPDVGAAGSGTSPTAINFGSVVGLNYNNAADLAYRVLKIPNNLVVAGNPPAVVPRADFHIHWTKSADTDMSGATIRWQLRYTVFNGISDEIALVGSTLVEWDDTYDDAGTTTRIVHRTANSADVSADLIPGNYIGVSVGFDTGNTTLANPVVISADLLWKGWLNV